MELKTASDLVGVTVLIWISNFAHRASKTMAVIIRNLKSNKSSSIYFIYHRLILVGRKNSLNLRCCFWNFQGRIKWKNLQDKDVNELITDSSILTLRDHPNQTSSYHKNVAWSSPAPQRWDFLVARNIKTPQTTLSPFLNVLLNLILAARRKKEYKFIKIIGSSV